MIRFLIVFFTSLVFSSLALAGGTPGKYKIELVDKLSNLDGAFVFLMNAKSEIRSLEEKGKIFIDEFTVTPFSDVVDFDVDWGSENGGDRHYFSFSLLETGESVIMIKLCSVYVDSSKKMNLNGADISISKWNKRKRSYEKLKLIQSKNVLQECRESIRRVFL